MADTTDTIVQEPIEDVSEQKIRPRSSLWRYCALGSIMLISIFMNFYQLGQTGYPNLYYAAGVKSMGDNLHNFFFVSFDPGGFVTIDKPPLGFWLQTISTKIFGFTAFSILLPQALAGVLSVALLFWLVRRHFGTIAGLLAALALAISPISVVTNRNNTIDSTLTLVMLLGAWAVLRAAETGRLRWLLLCAVTIGIGFNIKMLEAYLVVPAFGLLYLLASPHRIGKRVIHLLLACVLLASISLSWLVIVDAIPASARPYVGSSQTNSEIELAFGYNGITRLLGRFGGGSRASINNNAIPLTNNGTGSSSSTLDNIPGLPPTSTISAQGPGFGGGNMFGTGEAGPLRLFQSELGGQIAWILPLALLGMLTLAWQRKFRFQNDREQQSLILWGMWLLTMGIFFSVAGFFHQYYLTTMAPALSALFGIGLVVMWRDFRGPGWRGWLLPLALIATAAEQIYLLADYPTWSQFLTPMILVMTIVAVGILVANRIAPHLRAILPARSYLIPAFSIGILALLIAPTVWAAIPVLGNSASQLPVAGPAGNGGFGRAGNFSSNALPQANDTDRAQNSNMGLELMRNLGGGNGFGRNADVDQGMLRYLEANQGQATYLVATPSSNTADNIILTTNKPVMALGGFSGGDPILTTNQLAAMVSQGTVRFFLLNSFGMGRQIPVFDQDNTSGQANRDRFDRGNIFGGNGSPRGQSNLTSWITTHCTEVPTSTWSTGNANVSSSSGLYDCANAKIN
ncbi:ArnT family glycosyltransferase [Ktedonospora formicarum]|uniref:Dolichyl-phosphate-mannose--protein mannosyltransferase n=1 Tax=Ktedonospora formicarum TaxID=2778364 RepID=A0A8J3MTV0_9CHLR|nr:glycosyltransferase family 39 protein [Ktedonospora formicarum]GHO46301.1 dolichyl-phosphate-mannose--protein mannosyltransferase [Ktedonospora formicarum]